ncbi:MAG TPA: sigma-70 family RNA polymerase sigma factor [Phycisphaerae bacterium]|nr:sigma-70 family RNA polymerase sigma factor [Phycisphaerae bacterium]
MSENLTRRSLLVRVRDADDDAAWAEFETLYRDLITRYARVRGLQPADADDVCQAVMARLCRSLRRFEYDSRKGRFRTYLYRAVRNAIVDQFARPNRLPTAVQPDEATLLVADTAEGGDAEWEREWENHHLRLAMATIRRTFDEASVQMFERLLAGDSVEQVAEAFGSTPPAVQKIKQRIRARMQELIARQIAEEDEPDAGPA